MRNLFLLITLAKVTRSEVCFTGNCAQVVTVPVPCPPYSTTAQGAVQLMQCVCVPGAFGNRTGAPCTQCPLGTFSNTLSAANCTSCSYGTYMDAVGATSCWDCPFGVNKNVIGAQNNSFCSQSRWVVWLVVQRMVLSAQEVATTIALFATALGIPPSQYNRISILSTRRRNLLSTGTTTFQISASSPEQANVFSAQLTYPFLVNTVFKNSTIPPPAAILSVGAVDLDHPPATTQAPTNTPAPTDTPSPTAQASMDLIPIVAGAGGGVVGLILLVTLGWYLGTKGKLNPKTIDVEPKKTLSRIRTGPMPVLKVRINHKMV